MARFWALNAARRAARRVLWGTKGCGCGWIRRGGDAVSSTAASVDAAATCCNPCSCGGGRHWGPPRRRRIPSKGDSGTVGGRLGMRGTPTVPASSTRALRVAVTGRRRPSKGEAGTVVGRFGTRGIPTCPSCNLYDERGRIPNGGDSGTGGCATLPRPRWARCCSSFSSSESRERTS